MLETKNVQDILVVKLKDTHRLSALIAEPVKDQLLEYFNKAKTRLVLDLSGITFIDSSGFNVLLSAMKAANNNYGQFKLCNVNSEVMELFKLLQLHHVLEIYAELDSCLESFNQ